MEDPILNRRIEETRELHTRWGQFHEFFNMAIKSEKLSAEAEKKFLELKTRICMLHDGFMQSLKHDQNVGQQVLGILGACIMLKRIPLMTSAEVQKLELDWNQAYLLMTETIANMEEERQDLANINEKTYRMNKMREAFMFKVHSIFNSLLFRVLFFAILIPAFLIVGLPALDILDWWELKYKVTWLRTPMLKIEEGWRKWINPELKYIKFDEIAGASKDPGEGTEYKLDKGAKISTDQLIAQLIHLGFSSDEKDAGDLARVRDLIKSNRAYRCEGRQMKKTNRWGMAYYFLFQSPADAKEFCEKRRKGIRSYDKTIQDRVDSIINVCQKSNFVAIFASEDEVLRIKIAKDKWGFDEAQMRK